MKRFAGFPEGSKLSKTAFPSLFFSELLPMIDDLAELKLTLFCFWALNQQEGRFRYLRRTDFVQNDGLMEGLRAVFPEREPIVTLDVSLARALERGTLLMAQVALPGGDEILYFVNTALGRDAVERIKAGAWAPGEGDRPIEILPERPSIFSLYEANIGALTPMIAESLKHAAQDYPSHWIEDAFRAAVEHNKRNWRYIQSILKRWETEGRDRGFAGRAAGQDGQDFIRGKFADFIEH